MRSAEDAQFREGHGRSLLRLRPRDRVTPAMEAGVADHVWSIDVKRFLVEMSERPAYQRALQTTMPKGPPPM